MGKVLVNRNVEWNASHRYRNIGGRGEKGRIEKKVSFLSFLFFFLLERMRAGHQ